MAKITRYDGNLQSFAEGATGTERTIFGDTAQSDDLTLNITSDFLRGWGIVGVNETPSKQDFNAGFFVLSRLLAYLHQVGIPEWNVAQEYNTDSITSYGGVVYVSDGDANIGNEPGVDAGWTNPLDAYAALAGATFTGPVNTARGSITMHATTMDIWAQPNIIDGTGSAVTITAIANAPQAGAVRILYPITGTIITHGATFSVEGGRSYTTVAGDALVIEAVTTSTYNVRILRKTARTINVVTGSRAAATDYTNSSGGEMLVSVWCSNNGTAGGTGHQFLVDGVVVAQQIYAGASLAAGNASSGTTYEVPNGSTYRVALVDSTIAGWVEQNY